MRFGRYQSDGNAAATDTPHRICNAGKYDGPHWMPGQHVLPCLALVKSGVLARLFKSWPQAAGLNDNHLFVAVGPGPLGKPDCTGTSQSSAKGVVPGLNSSFPVSYQPIPGMQSIIQMVFPAGTFDFPVVVLHTNTVAVDVIIIIMHRFVPRPSRPVFWLTSLYGCIDRGWDAEKWSSDHSFGYWVL